MNDDGTVMAGDGAASRLGRSPYRVEAAAVTELLKAWLRGTLEDVNTPTAERETKGREAAADAERQLVDLQRQEREEVAARRGEFVACLGGILKGYRATGEEAFDHLTQAASQVPGPEEARQALALTLREGRDDLAAVLASRAIEEGWEEVFVEWCGRRGWPQKSRPE